LRDSLSISSPLSPVNCPPLRTSFLAITHVPPKTRPHLTPPPKLPHSSMKMSPQIVSPLPTQAICVPTPSVPKHLTHEELIHLHDLVNGLPPALGPVPLQTQDFIWCRVFSPCPPQVLSRFAFFLPESVCRLPFVISFEILFPALVSYEKERKHVILSPQDMIWVHCLQVNTPGYVKISAAVADPPE